MGAWSFSRAARSHGLCLMAFTVPVALCGSHEAKLAGVRPRNLPKGTDPEPWATAPATHDSDDPDDGAGEVGKWSRVHQHPHVKARAWRLVRELPDDSFEWCVRRVKFLTATGEKTAGDLGCSIVEYGSEFLKDEFSALNAFKDNSQSGCALKDPVSMSWYIGISCLDPFELDQIQILQMSEKRQGTSAKLQQMIAGQWMDVTGAFDLVPLKKMNTVFQAATCQANLCDSDLVLKTSEVKCSVKACTKDECCTKQVQAQWTGAGYHSQRVLQPISRAEIWTRSWGAPSARSAGIELVGLMSGVLVLGVMAKAYRHRSHRSPNAVEAESMVLDATDSERA